MSKQRPVDIIRKMNPGKWIPTGAELAQQLKSKKAKKKPLEKGFVMCPDCKKPYKEGMPHIMFCAAHTCDGCGTSYPETITKNSDGKRVCQRCVDGDEDWDNAA